VKSRPRDLLVHEEQLARYRSFRPFLKAQTETREVEEELQMIVSVYEDDG